MITRRATTYETAPVHYDWKSICARMNVGDRVKIKDRTQAQVGSACAAWNKDGKRFVSKKAPEGVWVIRVS